MHRSLITGVAAAVMLLVTPGPSGAAGVTRTAPFDYGVQCLDRFASASASPIGVGTPYGCADYPDAAAQMGRLSTHHDVFATRAGLIQQGFTNGAVANLGVGSMESAAGVYASSGVGGRLTASALVDGFAQDTYLCLFVGWRGQSERDLTYSCGSQSPTVVLDKTIPNTEYQIEVRLMTPQPNSVGFNYPCPQVGAISCTGGTTWTASQRSGITVRQISYSFG